MLIGMSNASGADGQQDRNGTTDELVERLDIAERDLSAATVAYHAAIAEHLGLSETEEQAVDILLRRGPLTHAELTEELGLAKPTVSDLIGRLEARGYADRTPHPDDRRRILVEVSQDRIYGELGPLFAAWTEKLHELYAGYSEEQLSTIADFMARATAARVLAAGNLALFQERA